ncbi:hypothetical protein E3J62_08205 [candidate division TA06 bacterium]|uniref:THIF-type NAD/FAD binding fold domain-containing protein n=1 Tax=candidate division TA06 bacterium TaxID=2250710 RepID=A0A523URS3_UNCT6|nr:MAG: hypothetical protein E3J62_08205 [candidate division TA06 bacterium]
MSEDRYSGIRLIDWIGDSGREMIKKSSCTIIGCGALGCASSNLLVRFGFGSLKIVDRDFVELPNLERQILFDENDARMMKPKAIAAAEKLSSVNSEVRVNGVVTDVNSGNIDKILADCDLVVDGTDNLETRYLINDTCVKHKIPWVHGACLSSSGMSFNILPGGPCFRCMYAVAPELGRTPTCETEGILTSVPQLVGAIQATEAVKIICKSENISRRLIHVDLAAGTFEAIAVERSESCPACVKGHFEYLGKERTSSAVSLCGRNSVQIVPANETTVDLKALEKKLKTVGDVSHMGYLLNFKKEGHELVVFPDGRAIVRGTSDIGLAKSLYSRYIGN